MNTLRSLWLACGLSVVLVIPAHAQWAVIDAPNLVQTTLTAIRSLQQINNQIQSLENEAVMLTNEAKNLKSLNFNSLSRLLAIFTQTNQLLAQAQGLSLTLQRTQGQFARLYPTAYGANVSNTQMANDAYSRWQNSLEALRTSVNIQSQSTQNFASDAANLSDLVTQSQNAVGALSAQQATNQLLALQSRQLIQQQQIELSQDRATAMEQSRTVAAQERSRQVRLLFTTGGALYTPQPVGGFGN